jgi:hypothetical protein
MFLFEISPAILTRIVARHISSTEIASILIYKACQSEGVLIPFLNLSHCLIGCLNIYIEY